ncbi:MAG: phosphate signaling complex protein PhoU [gamma proteobacterium symbiont of Bathyaustriella thionipta]|nr:phosphate signaling complex protein PhoU [gamma proteobacterium symbiont of Bathyaustriella thionipta]
MNEISSGHTIKSYDRELESLHRAVVDAGRLVETQIVQAVRSLEDEDLERAGEVVAQDKKIDDIELMVDDQIIHIIAKRQPMAKDLREIMAVGKIMSDLERIGDQARRIARLTLHFYDSENTNPPSYVLLADIPKLALLVVDVLHKAVDAFADLDSQLAFEVIRMNSRLDEEMKAALRRLSTYLIEDARNIGHIVEITLELRALERISGHAAYIARHTIFLVKGKDVRHENPEKVERELME